MVNNSTLPCSGRKCTGEYFSADNVFRIRPPRLLLIHGLTAGFTPRDREVLCDLLTEINRGGGVFDVARDKTLGAKQTDYEDIERRSNSICNTQRRERENSPEQQRGQRRDRALENSSVSISPISQFSRAPE